MDPTVHPTPDGDNSKQIDARDRGLHYADGLFETIAVVEGCPLLWDIHVHRLEDGCRRLGLPMPDIEWLEREFTSRLSPTTLCVGKIVVTAGSGGRGYRRAHIDQSNVIISMHPWPDYPSTFRTSGVRLRWCETTTSHNVTLAGIKHLGRLENVIARNEWTDTTIAEGLMCDHTGAVIEGTMTNLFAVLDGRIVTPCLDGSGVAGVMREWVIAALEIEGFRVSEQRLSREELESASEVFVTNSIIGCWPVRSLAGINYQIGPFSSKVLQLLDSLGGGIWAR